LNLVFCAGCKVAKCSDAAVAAAALVFLCIATTPFVEVIEYGVDEMKASL
jgi:hypothetical protein